MQTGFLTRLSALALSESGDDKNWYKASYISRSKLQQNLTQ